MKYYLTCLFFGLISTARGQVIQATIKPGPAADQVDVYIKPDFTESNQFLYQLQFPISFPSGTSPAPTGLIVEPNPEFIKVFGKYDVKVYPMAHNTAGTLNYFVISMVRESGSVLPSWTEGKEFRVMTFKFMGSSGLKQARLSNFQDGGSDSQGNYYTVNGNGVYYYSTNSVLNFYSVPGKSTVVGDAVESYVLVDLPK